jgi:transcriptional regulator with XRE-family HTH domain
MRERIKQIIEREGMSQSQFADYIGVNRPTLSHVIAGRNNPSLDIMMSIHRNFPKINVHWLFDGIGPYEEGDTGHPQNIPIEDSTATMNASIGQQTQEDYVAHASSATPIEEQVKSRFYQGELFAENPKFVAESTGDAKKRKEMPLQTPQKATYLTETQVDYTQKKLSRKIVEIKVFYDDGTYETFKH